MRRTKIVCTIGPASESKEVLQQLLSAGMDVARLNFSHGTHEEHGERIKLLKLEAARAGKQLGILLDTKGPEIRIGMMPTNGAILQNDSEFILDTLPEAGSEKRVSITYPELWQEIQPGQHVLLDDGLIDLEIMEVSEGRIFTKVINGGILRSQKGLNVPNVRINLLSVNEKDTSDILFGIQQGIDFIAASFTRKAEDILAVRRIVENAGASTQIIAKIENREGFLNLDAILEVADGIMVARGDLGVEIPVEEVPIYQKEMIRKCNTLGKPVIVATQMLDSMIRQPKPTRAEASDVANAILDGTDAIMLSGETAIGRFPVEAVKMMDKIAARTESVHFEKKSTRNPNLTIAEAIGYACYTIADDLNAAAIITPTATGLSARLISKYRPNAKIIATTPFASTARRLCLQWGVYPLLVQENSETDQVLSIAVNAALLNNLIQTGDLVVITGGIPAGKTGSTNLIKVHVVSNACAKGIGIGRKTYSGTARCILQIENAVFNDGDILVTAMTDASFIPLISRAGALITEIGGLTSHAAIAALQFGIPVIVGAANALENIKDNSMITVDAITGIAYEGAVDIL